MCAIKLFNKQPKLTDEMVFCHVHLKDTIL